MPTESPVKLRHSALKLPLADILFVMVLITCVTAILWPMLRPSQSEARQMACASGMKQLGLAFLQYEQDNDGNFPPKFFQGPQGWAGRVYPYVRNPVLYACPDDTTSGNLSAVPVSFAINQNVIGKVSDLHQQAVTVLLFEISGARVDVSHIDEGSHGWKERPASGTLSACGNGLPTQNRGHLWGAWGRGGPVITYATGDMGGREPLNGGNSSVARHAEGSNFLSADGHARHLLPEQVSSGTDGKRGNFQDHRRSGRAAATDRMLLSDGKTPALMTFSGT